MTEEVKDALIKNIRRRMTPQPLKIRADVEMKCFQFDGVLHIKVLLRSFITSHYLCCWLILPNYHAFFFFTVLLSGPMVSYIYSCLPISAGSYAES